MAKIMLVEDDNNLREIYGARLQAEGHEIVAAKDGEEALALAVKEKPELIISDVMMPRISGFDMLDILRNAPETKNTKVIMMTALSQAEDKTRADKLGADRYLVKSQVTLEDVARVVRDVLEGKTEDVNQLGIEGVSSDPNTPAETPPAETPPAPAPPAPEPSSQPAIAGPAPVVTAPAPEPTVTAPESAVPETPPGPADAPILMPDPVALTPAPDPVAPAADPPAPEPEPIKVELPTPPGDTAAETPAVETAPIEAPSEDENFVGPSLAEALASEEDAQTSPAQGSTTQTEESAVPSTAPTITNGVTDSVVAPSVTAPEEPATAPELSSEPEQPQLAEPHDNPLSEESATKKKVIQPINDLSKKPDLDALVAAEEQKAAVINPGAASVISPLGSTDPSAQPPAPGNDHDQIAL